MITAAATSLMMTMIYKIYQMALCVSTTTADPPNAFIKYELCMLVAPT